MDGDPGPAIRAFAASLTPTPVGTTHRLLYLLRATYPDGRIEDSQPAAHRLVNSAEAFGRKAFPYGTRFGVRARVITTTATGWLEEECANKELARRRAEEEDGPDGG